MNRCLELSGPIYFGVLDEQTQALCGFQGVLQSPCSSVTPIPGSVALLRIDEGGAATKLLVNPVRSMRPAQMGRPGQDKSQKR